MARVIPSYRDARSIKTLKQSLSALEQGYSIMLYPEDVDHMYNNVFIEFLPGFVLIAERHYRVTGEDIPVCPCYFSAQFNTLIIDKPLSVIKMREEGKTREEIADFFRVKANDLFLQHIKPIIQKKAAKYEKFNKA